MRPLSITPQQYADEIAAKSCKVAKVYDESTLNNVFIGAVESSIRHKVRNYWATHPKADLMNIVFQAELLLATQKRSGN